MFIQTVFAKNDHSPTIYNVVTFLFILLNEFLIISVVYYLNSFAITFDVSIIYRILSASPTLTHEGIPRIKAKTVHLLLSDML